MSDLQRASIPNTVPCAHCGAPLDAEQIDDFRVTPIEAREYHGAVREGEIVCAVCWHDIKWPRSQTIDEDGMISEEEWSEYFP